MLTSRQAKLEKALFVIALTLMLYMPLHVFIAQSASLLTGGLDVWKAAKDVVLVLLVPLLLYVAYRRRLFEDKSFRLIMLLGAGYTFIHMLYVLFDGDDHTYSAIVASVYNTRLFGFLLLGYVVGSAKNGKKYVQYLLTVAVVIASLVATFGVAQYFLPPDLLESAGYSVERGVKPLFFIDDRTDLPRVMSTLRDPNSLGAYLILPLLASAYAFLSPKVNKELFIRPFRRGTLALMVAVQFAALMLTFSRGALLGLSLSIVALLYIVTGQRAWIFLKKYWYLFLIFLSIITVSIIAFRESTIVQDYVFHAAVSTNEQDPNAKRINLQQQALEDISRDIDGKGPGSAGLVAITNPQGGLLTENYYLQIAYEVGWLGVVLFVAILGLIAYQLAQFARHDQAAAVLLAAFTAYAFYSLLIHLWSNEAVALQWWLLAGAMLGSYAVSKKHSR